ncbi:TraM recognition domain-containing protein, partial [Micromonospora aurantiaca]
AHPNHFGDDLMARIMISQLIEKVTIELPFNGYYIPSKHRLLFMLPDFCKIGKIPVYENSMGYMAGYGFKSLIFIDGISELERLYGKNNLIMLNSQVQLFYTNTDERTIEYVDNLLITDKREVVKLSTGNGILKVSGRKPLLV